MVSCNTLTVVFIFGLPYLQASVCMSYDAPAFFDEYSSAFAMDTTTVLQWTWLARGNFNNQVQCKLRSTDEGGRVRKMRWKFELRKMLQVSAGLCEWIAVQLRRNTTSEKFCRELWSLHELNVKWSGTRQVLCICSVFIGSLHYTRFLYFFLCRAVGPCRCSSLASTSGAILTGAHRPTSSVRMPRAKRGPSPVQENDALSEETSLIMREVMGHLMVKIYLFLYHMIQCDTNKEQKNTIQNNTIHNVRNIPNVHNFTIFYIQYSVHSRVRIGNRTAELSHCTISFWSLRWTSHLELMWISLWKCRMSVC